MYSVFSRHTAADVCTSVRPKRCMFDTLNSRLNRACTHKDLLDTRTCLHKRTLRPDRTHFFWILSGSLVGSGS